MIRAALYLRISRDMAGEGLGVARQEADCRALAKDRGWAVVEVFTDNDLSAYSGKRRPGYRSLLSAIEHGEIDVVVVWHVDRLYRRVSELEEYITICQPHSVATHAVQSGHIDLATPSGRMVARQLGAVAQYESEHKGERQKRANRQRAEEGGWFSTVRPFGYTMPDSGGVVSLVEEEAEALRDAYQLILDGGSIYEVTRRWNDRGLTTPKTGSEWRPPGVTRQLRYARHAGMRTYHGEIVTDSETGEPVEADWPAIVDRETWYAAQAILKDPRRNTRSAFPSPLLLSGIARCGTCEALIESGGRKNGKQRYRCSRVPAHAYRQSDPIDALVRRAVLERIAAGKLSTPAATDKPTVETIRDEIADLRQRMDGLALSYADGSISLAQMNAGTARLRARIEEAEARYPTGSRALARVITAPVAADAFDALTLSSKREIVRALVDIRILPAGHPSRSTVTEDGITYANPDTVKLRFI